MNNKLVVVAMSGGVDSSVAAALLQQKGYNVVGMTMCFNLPEAQRRKPRCCGPQDIEDASRVCHHLGVRHYRINLSRVLKEKVIKDFCSQYIRGCTPNPCVVCNQFIKFGALMEKAHSIGADYLATGHYANICYNRRINKFQLKKGKDKNKDQSYFLYRLNQAQLSKSLMPLGNLTKQEVRLLARKFNLPVAEKPASQEICFLPQDDYGGFLKAHSKTKNNLQPGPIMDKQGNILGRHKGAAFYTIGQRKGLGIAASAPLYVIKINSEKNAIIVGEKKELLSFGLIAKNIHCIAENISKETKIIVKIRYNNPGAEARLIPLAQKKVKVLFRYPQTAVTPGQSAVFYKGINVLGGAIIEEALKNEY